jgi:hypothetical protein
MPPVLQVLPEECGEGSDHEGENLTSAQRELMELLSPQAVPKMTPLTSDIRPSMSSVFRIKDDRIDGLVQPVARRKKRIDQAWSQQQLSLLDEFQSNLKVRGVCLYVWPFRLRMAWSIIRGRVLQDFLRTLGLPPQIMNASDQCLQSYGSAKAPCKATADRAACTHSPIAWRRSWHHRI